MREKQILAKAIENNNLSNNYSKKTVKYKAMYGVFFQIEVLF